MERTTPGTRLTPMALDLVDVSWRQSIQQTISVSTRTGVARRDGLVPPTT